METHGSTHLLLHAVFSHYGSLAVGLGADTADKQALQLGDGSRGFGHVVQRFCAIAVRFLCVVLLPQSAAAV